MESMQAFAVAMPYLIAVWSAVWGLFVLLGKARITAPFTLERMPRRRERLTAALTITLQIAVLFALALGLIGTMEPWWLPVGAVAVAPTLAALLERMFPGHP
jgi:hypothetical protein